MQKNATFKKSRRVSLSLEQKVEIVRLVCEEQVAQHVVANKYGVNKATISRVIKMQGKYLTAYNAGETSIKSQKIRTCNFNDLEKAMVRWISEAQEQNCRITGSIILKKAKEVAQQLNLSNFKGSQGWLWRFKERHGLTNKIVSGQDPAVSDSVDEWLARTVPILLSEYNPDDIYNCDESTLFYSLLPNQVNTIEDQYNVIGEQCKSRLIVFLCANMSGTDKRQPFVIGQNKDSHCLRSVCELPVVYTGQQNLQQTNELFETWLKKFDDAMRLEDRHVLLLSNQLHFNESFELTNIKLQNFPTKPMLNLQPLNAGIITSFKASYRTQLLQKYVVAIESKSEDKFAVNIREAMYMILSAWANVRAETVRNCYRIVGFDTMNATDLMIMPADELTASFSIWEIVASHFKLDLSFDTYVNIDDKLRTVELTNAMLVDSTQAVDGIEGAKNSGENDESDGERLHERQLPPSTWDAMVALSTLRYFFQCNSMQHLNKETVLMEETIVEIAKSRLLQQKICDYFHYFVSKVVQSQKSSDQVDLEDLSRPLLAQSREKDVPETCSVNEELTCSVCFQPCTEARHCIDCCKPVHAICGDLVDGGACFEMLVRCYFCVRNSSANASTA